MHNDTPFRNNRGDFPTEQASFQSNYFSWLGYSITSAAGNTFTIDTLSPTGPLTYRCQLPFAAVNVDMTKRVAFKSSWNYYDYCEYSDSGPTLPRNFRGNVYTLSLRYAF